jgi:hypothetical protein
MAEPPIQVNDRVLVRAPVQNQIAATWLLGTVTELRPTEIVVSVMDMKNGKRLLLAVPNPPLNDEWRR